MTQFFFNRNTIDNLKFYVYGLKDPFTNKYFYIGKGKANRVFSHVNQKIKRGIDDPKYEKIKEIRSQGGKVKIDIIRHNSRSYVLENYSFNKIMKIQNNLYFN